MRILLLINPRASRAHNRVAAIRSWFETRCDAVIVSTTGEDHVREALRDLGSTVDRIVICGGDGTLSCALPELVRLNKTFAILPAGTANDFARTISVPLDFEAAAEIALNGVPHPIDVGLVNGHHFINVASVGAATRVTAAQSPRLKKFWRALSYIVSLRKVLSEVKPFTASIEIDDDQMWRGRVYQIGVGNGRFHGGGMSVAELAAIDDGTLHLYFILPGSYWQVIRGLLMLRLGRPAAGEALGLRQGRKIRITTRRTMPINADGEIVTETPATFSVIPEALVVMTPAELPPAQRGLLRASPNEIGAA